MSFKFSILVDVVGITSDVHEFEITISLSCRLWFPLVLDRKLRKNDQILSIDSIDSHQDGKLGRLEIRDEIEEVILDLKKSDQVVRIGTSLSPNL